MKKFIVHCRAIPGKDKNDTGPFVVEVEGEHIQALEDPSILWRCQPGEFDFRIMKPTWLYDLDKDKKTTIPPVYCSHAIYESKYQALVKAHRIVKLTFERNKEKHNIDYSEEDLKKKMDSIQEIFL